MNIKRSTRLTRRSYRRKLIMFGVSVFMSLALTATGFAAWVLSKNAEVEESGSVEIGAVTESSIDITEIAFIKDNDVQLNPDHFIFEPLESDTTGRVRYDGSSQPENLDVKFTWTINNFQIVGDVFVDFKVPETVYTAIEKNWISLPNAFELLPSVEQISGENYKVLRYSIQDATKKITSDVALTEDGVLSYKVTKDGDGVITAVEFTMNIAFSWGTEFNTMNPGLYYDIDNVGKEIAYETVKATLNEFKATLHGIEYNQTFENLSEVDKNTLYDENPISTYLIVINAKVA